MSFFAVSGGDEQKGNIGVAPITAVTHVRNNDKTFKGGHLRW